MNHIGGSKNATPLPVFSHGPVLKVKGKAGFVGGGCHGQIDGHGVRAFALQSVVGPRDVARIDDILQQRVVTVGEIAGVRGRIVLHDALELVLGCARGSQSG